MKQDIKNLATLQTTAAQLAKLKYDTLVHTDEMLFSCINGMPSLKIEGYNYPMLERAQKHISELVQMPFTYFQRLRDTYPQLLSYNINSLLPRCDSSKPRLVRNLGGKCRAIVSNKFKMMEHENVLESISPLINEYKLDFASASIDDDHLRLKLISRKSKVTPVVGTTVCFGVLITNSETSAASLSVTPFAMKLQCTNGLILPEYFTTQRKIHRGAELLSLDDYVAPSMDNIVEHIGATIDSCLDSSNYAHVLDAIRKASEMKLADPVASIQAAAKHLSLTNAEQGSALMHLLNSKDFTLLGLSDAITLTGQDAETYARATYLEEAGASVLFNPLKSKPADDTLFIAA